MLNELAPLVRLALSSVDDNNQFLLQVRSERYAKIIPDCYSGRNKYGFRPDITITNRANGRPIFLDLCRRGFERIFKSVAPFGVTNLKKTLNISYNPSFFIFYDQLALQSNYISKFAWYLEPERYFLWTAFPKLGNLTRFLRQILVYTR